MPETNFGSLSGTAGDNQASSIKVREGCTFKGFDKNDQNTLIFERTDDIQLEFQYENLNQNGMNANDKLTSYSCECQGRLVSGIRQTFFDFILNSSIYVEFLFISLLFKSKNIKNISVPAAKLPTQTVGMMTLDNVHHLIVVNLQPFVNKNVMTPLVAMQLLQEDLAIFSRSWVQLLTKWHLSVLQNAVPVIS